MKKNDRRDAAIEYVRRGWLIFPVPPGLKCGYSKDRHITDGPWGCTGDEDVVRRYWNDLPRANIGLVMGVGSGIFDIECDTASGHPNLKQDGAVSLTKLEAQHGKLPATLMFESPSGSRHHLFKHPGGDVRIRSGPLDAENYPGIDCKGDGGMSIAPPSRTRKGVYKWINKRRVAAAPEWLLAMVRRQEYAPRESDPFAQFANSIRLNMAELTLAVAMIPNDDLPWDPCEKTGTPGWNAIGMAIYDATDGSVEGYRLFNAFSQRSRKYNAKTTRKKWTAFRGCPPNSISAGTIFFLAEQAVPNWRERMYFDHKVIALIREFYELLEGDNPSCGGIRGKMRKGEYHD